jgi:hypothetical protein
LGKSSPETWFSRPFPDGFPYNGLLLVGTTTTFVGWEQQAVGWELKKWLLFPSENQPSCGW